MARILFIGLNPTSPEHYESALHKGHKILALKKFKGDCDSQFEHVFLCDPLDIPTVLKHVKEYHEHHPIDACFTRFEPSVPTASAVCKTLTLKGPDPLGAFATRDKLLMRQLFAKAGVPQPQFHAIYKEEDLQIAAQKLNFPLLLKPISGAKSRLIHIITTQDELIPTYRKMMSALKKAPKSLFQLPQDAQRYAPLHNPREVIIAEEYLKGKQITTTTIVQNKTITHIACADVYTAQDYGCKGFYLVSRTTPSVQPDAIQEQVKEISTQAIKALNLDNTAVHPELLITDKGVIVIEVAARVGGYRAGMTERALGISLNEIAITLALGDKTTLNNQLQKKHTRAATAVEFWPPEGSGQIKAVEGIDYAKEHTENFTLKIKPGNFFEQPPMGEAPVATYFTSASTPEESKVKADKAREKLNVIFAAQNKIVPITGQT